MTVSQNRLVLLGILVLAIVAGAVTFTHRLFGYDTSPRYGLDIKGGIRVVLRAEREKYKGTWTPDNLEAVRRILDRRVNFTGVSEPVIVTKPPEQIVIELPGVKNPEEAIKQLQSTASLEFYLLPELGNKDNTMPAKWRQETQVDPQSGQKEDVLVDNTTNEPVPPDILDAEVFSHEPVVTGKDLLPNSQAVIQPSSVAPVIEFEFNAEGSRVFEEATRANIGRYLAIFLDKKLLTAPTINNVIPGRGEIEGNFTLQSAKALADELNAGALPVPLELLETRKVEATLGREAVAATTKAGVAGLVLVLVFMLVYYRLPGFLADCALLLYTIFSIALFKIWPVTLTLPGIAGFILSIGMAVDANILIFERLKEELLLGKTLRIAIDTGFKRAFTAILDSNVCTIITCCVLYYFGTGPIRGFALTLGLGVGISMFTAITVTRTFLFALVSFGMAQHPSAYALGLHWARNLHVMRRKWLWLGLSGAIIVPGLIFWLGLKGIKYSIDFKGGTELQVPFASRHSAGEIERALGRIGPRYKDSQAVVANDPASAVKLAYVTTERLDDAQRATVINTLISSVGPLAPGETPEKIGYSNVSGTISKQLTVDAFEAVAIASLFITLYLAFRFAIGGFVEGLKYGLCAVAALLHDVLVVWGAFAILGYALNWQVDSLFVTAMLTVIGFSVHDTIVVFDRIRENLRNRERGVTFTDLTDHSIGQTIARSINTSFTVVLTLCALFFFGGSTIHQFSAALIIGIISGTYSSIFNASVLLVMWKQRDVGLAAAGAGRSALIPRPATPLPGDRPLVGPRPTPESAPSPRAATEPAGPAPAPRPSQPRSNRPSSPRRHQRRRRM